MQNSASLCQRINSLLITSSQQQMLEEVFVGTDVHQLNKYSQLASYHWIMDPAARQAILLQTAWEVCATCSSMSFPSHCIKGAKSKWLTLKQKQVCMLSVVYNNCMCTFIGASLSEPHHRRTTVKSVFLLCLLDCLLDTSSLIWLIVVQVQTKIGL